MLFREKVRHWCRQQTNDNDNDDDNNDDDDDGDDSDDDVDIGNAAYFHAHDPWLKMFYSDIAKKCEVLSGMKLENWVNLSLYFFLWQVLIRHQCDKLEFPLILRLRSKALELVRALTEVDLKR